MAEVTSGTVNLFGSRVKKGYVIAGGAVVGLAVLYGFYKNKQRSAANAAAAAAPASSASSYGAAGDPYPSDGTSGNPSDPNSIDPSSGVTYGDEGAFGAGYGYGGGYGGGGGGGYSYGGGGGTVYTTNGQWAQAAEQYLIQTAGADPTTVAAALGKYITGQPVTEAQASIIEQAIAFDGYPPVAGSNGNPPNYVTAQSPPPQQHQVTVPTVTGQPQEAAFAILSAAGLHATGSPVVKGKTLTVDSQSPPAGTKVSAGSTVTVRSTVHGAAKVKVPRVTGMRQADAFTVLSRAGLHATGPKAVRGKTHTVTAQSPQAGASVARGTTVRLTSRLS